MKPFKYFFLKKSFLFFNFNFNKFMKKIRFSILLVLFFCFESFYALKYYLKEGNEKCFLDEIPDQTVFFQEFLEKIIKIIKDVHGNYEFVDDIILLNPNNARNGVFLRIYDPKGGLMQNIKIVENKNKFAFTSQECICSIMIFFLLIFSDGKFKFCFEAINLLQYPDSEKRLKFEFRLQAGENPLKLENSAKNKEIVGILNHADLLRNKVEFFIDKQEFFLKKNEVVFRV